MRIPNDQQCAAVLKEMKEFLDDLTDWEHQFVCGNSGNLSFTVAQREVIGKLCQKYEMHAFKP